MAKKTADFSLEIRPNCSKTFERGPNSNGKRLIFSVLHLSDNLDDAKTVAVFAAGAPSDQDFDHLRAEMAKKPTGFSLEIRLNCSKPFERGPNSNGKRLILSVLHLSDNLDDAKTIG